MSFAPLMHRVMFVVEVELDTGDVGYGESWVNYPDWAWMERLATVEHGIAPLVVGRQPESPRDLHEHLLTELLPLGRQWGAVGPIYQAISALDIAVWDLAAKRAGQPLFELLGGKVHAEITAYGSSLGPVDVAETAELCRELGLTAAKVKVGFGPHRDIENLSIARRILGPATRLFADANQAWTTDEAAELLPRLAELGVEWIEEPIVGGPVSELELLGNGYGVPVAVGENLAGAESFTPYLHSDGVALLQPDISKVGGVTELLKVGRHAAVAGKPIAPHLYNGSIATAATIQVAATLTTTSLIEWDIRANPMREDVRHLLSPRGTVVVPTRPGLGVDIDLSVLAEFEEPFQWKS